MRLKYRVFVRGANLLMTLEGAPKLYGFYTHRFVKARSAEEARESALKLIETDLEGKILGGSRGQVVVEEVVEVGLFGGKSAGEGFTFFPEEPQA